MTKRILSILLTVAMLVAMVPAIAVSASAETGTTYEVGSIADVKHFLGLAECDCTTDTCKYAGGNAAGNTMKLTADLKYQASDVPAKDNTDGVYGLWFGLLANVDGNGHTVYVPGGYYWNGSILCYLEDGTDANNLREYTFKNLAVVMASDDEFAEHEEFIALFGENADYVDLTVENCYFDLDLKTTGNAGTAGSAVLLARHRTISAVTNLTVINSVFLKTVTKNSGRHGILVGRVYSNNTLNYTIQNCGFYNPNCWIIGQDATTTTTFDASGNLIFEGYGNGVAQKFETPGTPEGFTTGVSNKGIDTALTLGDAWTYTTVGSPIPKALVANGLVKNVETNVENTTVKVAGYQTSAVNGDKYNLRLVGVLSGENLANYSQVGFKVVANYGYNATTNNGTAKYTTAASNKVYTSLKGYENTQLVSYSKDDLGGYIFALAITGVPNANVTFEVTPYYVAADGTTVENGNTVVFTVEPPQNTVAPNAAA